MSPNHASVLAGLFQTRIAARALPGRPAALLLVGGGDIGAMTGLIAGLLSEPLSARAPRAAGIDLVICDPSPPDAAMLAAAWPGLPRDSRDLLGAAPWTDWPAPLPGLHRLTLSTPQGGTGSALRLVLAVGDPERVLPRLALAADLIVLQASAGGTAQPTSAAAVASRHGVPRALARLLAAGGSVAARDGESGGSQALAEQGWTASDAAGPSGWRLWHPGRSLSRLNATHSPAPAPAARQVAIVGAGLAGSACAAVFAARGWQVDLIDAAARPQPGSGQPLLADHLHLSPDDNPTARLSRHALWLSRPWRMDAPIGRFQMAMSEDEQTDQQRSVRALGDAARALAIPLTRDEAADLCGARVARGGLWLPTCGMARPAELCRDWLSEATRVRPVFGARVLGLRREDDRWAVYGADAAAIARAPVVILANAGDGPRLAGLRSLTLQSRRGRAIALSSPALRGLRSVIGGGAYACPLSDGAALVGLADPGGEAPDLSRLTAMLPALSREAPRPVGVFEGWRHAAADRLPLIGSVPDEERIRRDADAFTRNDRLPLPVLPGLYAHVALGARGLLWSILGAELLADLVEGRAPPLEADLIRALAPERFLRQALRQARLR
ncbi:MAG: FAD-dependent 5-carboxymethylaminomethyl-2-thiouridine(34) oxidoreductase MnmC [Betaproteobacteria bacterium]|nr:FAD-dependent 5-carboxymethylaminomethyl-2-thiouridine(34) oxidoreductase MnmC [Betaproteobacteria bacterium]